MYTLITGASSGVGRELAIYLSQTRSLILSGRNLERLEETKAHCVRNDTILWKYDLEKTESLENELSVFLRNSGVQVESFVHCAGLMKILPIRSVDYQTLVNTYSVNTFAAFLITKVLASRKINGRNLKSTVFISSNISERGATAFSAYGSSKAALDGLVRNLAVELAPNVHVNSILPGGMITAMTKEMFSDEKMKQQFSRNYPLGIGAPEDIAPMVEFLLSDKAKWITGQQFTVDGGRTIDITERKD